MVSLKDLAVLVAGFIIGAVLLVIGAIAGAVSFAITPFLIAGMAHLLGYLSLGTLEAIILWFAIPGAIIGALKVVVFGLLTQ